MDLKSRLLNKPSEGGDAAMPERQRPPHGAAAAMVSASQTTSQHGFRALSEPEREWQHRLHQELMTMVDLSVLTHMEEKEAKLRLSAVRSGKSHRVTV